MLGGMQPISAHEARARVLVVAERLETEVLCLEAARDSRSEPVPMHIRNAPTRLMKDLGFGEGYRTSWQTALLGGMARHGETFERNHLAWSGDHCSTDRALVPGILVSNRPIRDAADGATYTVRDICATVMSHFGLDLAPLHGESRPVRLGPVAAGR